MALLVTRSKVRQLAALPGKRASHLVASEADKPLSSIPGSRVWVLPASEELWAVEMENVDIQTLWFWTRVLQAALRLLAFSLRQVSPSVSALQPQLLPVSCGPN